jgi:hypothetical protein
MDCKLFVFLSIIHQCTNFVDRRYSKLNERTHIKHDKRQTGSGTVSKTDDKKEEEAVSIHLTPLNVIVLVMAMCGMLVLLYFFYKYLSK